MQKQYTPGPWFPVTYANYVELSRNDEYGAPSLLNLEDTEEAEINGVLAAAAPDLLEALVSLYTKFKGEGLGGDKWYGPIMDTAKKAIQKATGGIL